MSLKQKFRFCSAGLVLVGLTLAYILAWSIGSPLTIRSASALQKGKASPPGRLDLIEQALTQLDRIRRDKKAQLTGFLERIKAQAAQATEDKLLRECFLMRLRHHQAGPLETTAEALEARDLLEARIRRYCLENYREFSDVLFIDRQGTIFYCYHGSAHVGKCLLGPQWKDQSLAEKLARSPKKEFVDFSNCELTGEPSSFFIEPVEDRGRQVGWIVLQLGIEKINRIFIRDEALGRTGEAFLVNRNCTMLTSPRFGRELSPLRRHLSPENILAKFEMGRGRKTVTDYRGFRALSSFETCSILGSQWLLVTKIDEAEILTRGFLARREQLQPRLLEDLRKAPIPFAASMEEPAEAQVVEMDSFDVSRGSGRLLTYGIRTCTGILIHLPGQFACLGHLSTHDRVYGPNNLDLLGHMISRIENYEIYPSQKRNLQVVIVAPHEESIDRALRKLLDSGFLLSQIRFLHDPDARSSRLWHDVADGETGVRWNGRDENESPRYQRASDAPHLGDLARPLLVTDPPKP